MGAHLGGVLRSEVRPGVRSQPEVDVFPDLSPRAKTYCGVKCSQGLHLPVTYTTFNGKQDRSYIPATKKEVDPLSSLIIIILLCIISTMNAKNTNNIELV